MKLNRKVFIAPPPLHVPPNSHFSAYLINTNGLRPVTPLKAKYGTQPNKVNKIKVLRDLANTHKLDAVHITETHDQDPTGPGPLQDWKCTPSNHKGGIHGTATITASPIKASRTAENVAASQISWEGQLIWLVTAYFPNALEGTVKTVRALDRILTNLKGRRIILSGDFNSTETLSSFEVGGTKTPSNGKAANAEAIQELLDKWRLKDLWSKQSNPAREEERPHRDHLTHWNNKHTRGVRIDRVYANFEVDAPIEVTTHHHPSSDHRGVMYRWTAAKDIPSPSNTSPPLPHRAFKLKEVKEMAKSIFKDFEEQHLLGPNPLTKWDKAKRLVKEKAIKIWETRVRTRGANLRKLEKSLKCIERHLHSDRRWTRREETLAHMQEIKQALARTKAKDMSSRKEAITAKWIQMSGKPNKDFLAKPKGTRKRIGNMTIDNVKDQPDLPRTDDIKTILDNFVQYYAKLYAHKKVCPLALKRLVTNLTLELEDEQEEILNAEITREEMLRVIIDTPSNKTPGTDRLPYECYKEIATTAAPILAALGNIVTDTEQQPKSWAELLISVIPKEEDSYSTHKFRPISLLNTDYKLVMRIWANRLGPILAKLIGHHQRGFIPTRDGRENIINVQMIIDLINSKNEEGAVVFLDQEKAFDMVSFNTINTIFTSLNWPQRFRSLLRTVYHKDQIVARVKANGVTSEKEFRVNSGTRQGCPLSPLIYAVVADLYNMAVISHPQFRGHSTAGGIFTKISAYADDTAVHLSTLADIKIYRLLLRQYSLATGGITNFKKSEAVLLGRWRTNPPDLGIRTVKATKYLGVIVGNDPEMAAQAILEREAKVYRQLDHWDSRLSSSPIDRVMVAKIMCLSLVWYHAGLAPGWAPALNRIEKRVQAFIWKGGIPKVAKATLMMPKKDGGLGVWSLVEKANAFVTMWVVKLLTGRTNPLMEATVQAAVEWYAHKQNTQVPLWESRLDHSHDITALTGNRTLAMLQGAWSVVVRRHLSPKPGEWIAYYDDSSTKKKLRDHTYDGRAKVVCAPTSVEDTITADWYIQDQGRWAIEPLPPNTYWHLEPKKCYRTDNMAISSHPHSDLYLTVENSEGGKTKLKLEEILLDEEDMRPAEEYGPAFIKRNQNSKLYKAQLLRTCKTGIKVNAWERDYEVNLTKVRKLHLQTFAHSKVKGFMWLFISHALPVGTRLRGKDASSDCPICGKTEDIRHMAAECQDAAEIRKLVFTEWWSRTGDNTQATSTSFKRDFFSEEDSTLQRAHRTLNDICTYHIWKRRNDFAYGRRNKSPLSVIANNIWTEFTLAIVARCNHIDTKAQWWSARDEAMLVPTEVAQQNIEEIWAEKNNLTALLLVWERPSACAAEASKISNKMKGLDNSSRGRRLPYSRLPRSYPILSPDWRLTAVPVPRGNNSVPATLQVPGAGPVRNGNSAGKSAGY